ncbi:MAG: copper homeostasis membrane protein CopD [Pseudomonadota bacterium]
MIAIRLGLFLSLILLVGMAAFPLYALRKSERIEETVLPLRSSLGLLALGGLVLSAIGFLVLLASMTGNPLSAPDWATGRSILFETPIGTAWLVRMAALATAFWAAFSVRSTDRRLTLVTLAGAVALGSLVWTGHAGASEGNLGLVHKASDVLHMLAAAVWLGGIAAFLLLLRLASGQDEETRMMVGHRALGEFSRVGSVCVLIITGTGLVNAQILVGYENLTQALGSDYGRQLAVKLALVGAMLLLAAKNRWRLTPALGTAIEDGETGSATAALRTSLLLEAGAAVTILALVAWLGTLEPTASMAMP